MLSIQEIENKLKQLKPLLKERYHVNRIGYFGSYSNGRQTEQSDLDLLVDFSQPIGWEFFMLEEYLEKSLGLRIDLVTKNSLKKRVKESILNQVHYI